MNELLLYLSEEFINGGECLEPTLAIRDACSNSI
jgi:hypothetical protein